jgi:decaprenylphospho-beta-D-ribofuranose 2-oxidase
MKISGWGRYPIVEVDLLTPASIGEALEAIARNGRKDLISRGLGRSYGDSALASRVVQSKRLDRFLAFDETTGTLTCEAGVSLSDILHVFVPKGWFVSVTPGTKYVTVGGAISSDVHGKNHHKEGTFSDHTVSFKIATVNGGIVECSRTQNADLFHATCGGMGLTGFITEATFNLKPIKSAFINEVVIKARNLEETLFLFDQHQGYTYSVAWIDCLATGDMLGRSVLMLGEHSETGDLSTGRNGIISLPFDMPGGLLNHKTVKGFNTLYYHRAAKERSERIIHYEPFFYPLDKIQNWNRMYGKGGFVQYQFVLPRSSGEKGMRTILKRIVESKMGSFLAVLKAFGKSNDNYLSFPMEGYTLALDFKLEQKVFELLGDLDSLVKEYGGRLYMCKDSRMKEEMLRSGYPYWEKFSAVRKYYGADKIFNSIQSRRLGL